MKKFSRDPYFYDMKRPKTLYDKILHEMDKSIFAMFYRFDESDIHVNLQMFPTVPTDHPLQDHHIDDILMFTVTCPNVTFRIYHVHTQFSTIDVHQFCGERYDCLASYSYRQTHMMNDWSVIAAPHCLEDWRIDTPDGFRELIQQ